MKIRIYRINNTIVEVLLMKNKADDTYSFVNLSKGHICSCKFDNRQQALEDIFRIEGNLHYEIVEGNHLIVRALKNVDDVLTKNRTYYVSIDLTDDSRVIVKGDQEQLANMPLSYFKVIDKI